MQRPGPAPIYFLCLVWLWFCWPLLTGQAVAYRDTANLYIPLLRYLELSRDFRQIPFWNPFDNFGYPLIGDGASSFFYLPRIAFQILPFDFFGAIGWYISLHVLFAKIGAYVLARSWGCCGAGACIAALAYGLGGSVIFQTTNLIYLFGAAWLPWAMWAYWKIVFDESKWSQRRGIVALGAISLGILFLSGDAQMAYHVMLIAVALWVWRMVSLLKFARQSPASGVAFNRAWLASVAVFFALVAGVGIGYIQIGQSRIWMADCERTDFVVPRNVYELVAAERGDFSDSAWSGIWGAPVPNSHHDHVYQFSLPPWQLSELLWPNVSGRAYPHHSRWTDALPSADRMWVPSLYVGGVVLWLALSQFRLRGACRVSVAASWIVVCFVLGSFGWYGVGWLLQEFGWGKNLGAPVGGVYWLMVTFLPDYVLFRYPAKLFVVAQLGLSVLAGLSVTRFADGSNRRLPQLCWVGIGLTGVALIVWFIIGGRIAELDLPACPDFGPFRSDLATIEIGRALVHGGVVLIGGLAIFSNWPWLGHRRATTLLLMLTGIDLWVANRAMIPTVPSGYFLTAEQYYSPGLYAIPETHDEDFCELLQMIRELPENRNQFAEQSSPNRLAELLVWQQMTFQPKHHLPMPYAMFSGYSLPPNLPRFFDSFGSLESARYIQWRELINEFPDQRVNFVTHPKLRQPLPNRLAHSSQLQQTFVDYFRECAVEMEYDQQRAFRDSIDPVSRAAVLVDGPGDGLGSAQFFPDRIRWSYWTPNSIEIEFDSPTAGWLLVSDLYAPGWQVQFFDCKNEQVTSGEVVRMMGMFRGIPVPAGNQIVSLSYLPPNINRDRFVTFFAILAIILINMRLGAPEPTK